jgi:uncharacterized protein YbjT (DUF2867 family)
MNLVVGATGMVGTEICRLLTLAGKPVTALVRRSAAPGKIEKLKSFGAILVHGDLRDCNSLELACEGIDTVITTASAMPFAYQPNENTPQTTDEDGCLNLIEVAREAGVRRFVYTSFPPMAASFPLQDSKRAVEECLRNSGLTYVILQPTFFMEVWLSPAVGFDYASHKAVIYGTGDNPISWISTSDVARFAVACLDDPIALNATLELGGPNGVSPLEVVRIFETVGGRPFGVTHVPVEALRVQLEAATDPMQKSFTGLMLSYANTAPIDMSTTLKRLPLKLKTVADHAHSLMA